MSGQLRFHWPQLRTNTSYNHCNSLRRPFLELLLLEQLGGYAASTPPSPIVVLSAFYSLRLEPQHYYGIAGV